MSDYFSDLTFRKSLYYTESDNVKQVSSNANEDLTNDESAFTQLQNEEAKSKIGKPCAPSTGSSDETPEEEKVIGKPCAPSTGSSDETPEEEKVIGTPCDPSTGNSEETKEEDEKVIGTPCDPSTGNSEETKDEDEKVIGKPCDPSTKSADDAGAENEDSGEDDSQGEAVVSENTNRNFTDGELSKDGGATEYLNRLNLAQKGDSSTFDKIYQDLCEDKNLNAFDKYKLFCKLEEVYSPLKLDKLEKFTTILNDMSQNMDKYSIDEIAQLNNLYINAAKADNDGERLPLPENNRLRNQKQKDYCAALVNMYKACKGDSEKISQLEQIASLGKIAKCYQMSKYGGDETKILKELAAATYQSNLDYDNQEFAGYESHFSDVKDIMKAYKEGYTDSKGNKQALSQEQVLYCLSKNYQNTDELIDAFRDMWGSDQEKYIQDLFEILQYNPNNT